MQGTFGQWLKRLRAARDLTQEAAAEQIGCAAETLRAFERGVRRPSRTMAERLAEVFRVPSEQRTEFLRLARGGAQHEAEAPPAPEPLPPAPDMPLTPRRPILPLPTGSLIGRDHELDLIIARLHEPDCRVLTLVGPGGIGKTRLALQAADRLERHDDFADGVAWVNLAPVEAVAHIGTALATALDYTLHGSAAPIEQLIEYLRPRELVLVVDNLEHLIGAAGLLVDLLQAASGVRILATSRERLRIPGEWVIEIGGLPLPAGEAHDPDSPAVRLFTERARQIDHRFEIDREALVAIERICRLVRGMPLGIELAATWVRTLTCSEIADEIERGLDFLAVHGPVADPRHASLRAVFDHSWHTLSPVEQAVLMRLAIFRGGCRREAIEHVSARLPGARPLLPVLAALTDKSLLQRSPDAAGGTRYELHELVRQYAAERFAADPPALEEAAELHATFFAHWAVAQEPQLKSAQQKATLQAIGAEIDNLRTAWQWAISHGRADLLLQLACCLDWFFDVRGWTNEGAATFGTALPLVTSLAEREDATMRERACYWLVRALAGWHRVRHEPAEASAMLHEILPNLCDLGDPSVVLHNMVGLSYLALFTGDVNPVRLLIERGLALRPADDQWGYAALVNVLGVLESLHGNYAAALQFLSDALATLRNVGDPREIAFSLNNLGSVTLQLDRMVEAEQYYREALVVSGEHRNRFQMSVALWGLGRIASLRGDYAEAQWMLQEALMVAREADEQILIARAQTALANLARIREDLPGARRLHADAVATAATIPPVALDALLEFAAFEQAEEPRPAVVQVLEALRAHPRALPPTRARAAAELLRTAPPGAEPEALVSHREREALPPAALLRMLQDADPIC